MSHTKKVPKMPVPSTNPPPTLPTLTGEEKDELSKMQQNCFEHLHKPMVVKARGNPGEIWYVCEECLDRHVKENPKLKKILVGFRR